MEKHTGQYNATISAPEVHQKDSNKKYKPLELAKLTTKQICRILTDKKNKNGTQIRKMDCGKNNSKTAN